MSCSQTEIRKPGRPRKYPDIDIQVGGKASFKSGNAESLRLLRMAILKRAIREGQTITTLIQGNRLDIERVK